MTTVLVTGASQGIGAAIARAYAELPDQQVLLVARNQAKLAQVAAECEALGSRARAYACDLSDQRQIAQLFDRFTTDGFCPDILINNAGVYVQAEFAETTPAIWQSQWNTNVMSAALLTQLCLPAMRARLSGDIVFIDSVAGQQGLPGCSAYIASKHALLGLARSLRLETKTQGIRIITLLPGGTDTPSWDGAGVPAERLMPASDIAKLVTTVTSLDRRTCVEELIVRPQLGDI